MSLRSLSSLARLAVVTALVSTPLAAGCSGNNTRPGRDSGVDPGPVDSGMMVMPGTDSGRPVGGPCESADTDGDGIPDSLEGTADPDMDGMPNSSDLDSDGDGVDDSVERRGVCPPGNSDGDLTPDYLDADSDNDGLTDAEERELGTDATLVDSDGDGVSDLGEVRGSMTSPTDPASTIPEDDFFVILPYEGDHQMRPLRFGTNIARADVYFLIDTTGSMQAAINDVNSSLMSIAAEVARLVPDAQFGVGHFDDFPVTPYGNNAGEVLGFYVTPLRSCVFDFMCGAGEFCASYCAREITLPRDDAPYVHDIDITADLGRVNAALGLTVNGGNDIPESGAEALFLAATGMGLTYPNARTTTSSIPAKTCAMVAGETEPRRGYPCFRPGALPIVVTVTDAPFHNGASATTADWTIPYAGGVAGVAHTLDQAIASLNDLGARAIGVNVGSGPGGTAAGVDLTRLATMTGTVSSSGMPLVYTGAASTTASQIITGITSVVSGTPQDVSTRTANVAGNPDDFDATAFIQSIVPLEGYGRGGVMGPMPGITYTSRDATTFYGVIPGTEVEFTVDFWNDVRMPAATAQIFRARIIVVGNGVADLDEREVYIVVPPADTEIVLE